MHYSVILYLCNIISEPLSLYNCYSYDFERKIGFIPASAVKVVRKFKCERECYTEGHTYWLFISTNIKYCYLFRRQPVQ